MLFTQFCEFFGVAVLPPEACCQFLLVFEHGDAVVDDAGIECILVVELPFLEGVEGLLHGTVILVDVEAEDTCMMAGLQHFDKVFLGDFCLCSLFFFGEPECEGDGDVGGDGALPCPGELKLFKDGIGASDCPSGELFVLQFRFGDGDQVLERAPSGWGDLVFLRLPSALDVLADVVHSLPEREVFFKSEVDLALQFCGRGEGALFQLGGVFWKAL